MLCECTIKGEDIIIVYDVYSCRTVLFGYMLYVHLHMYV